MPCALQFRWITVFTTILCPLSSFPTFNKTRLWPVATCHWEQSSKVQLGFFCKCGQKPLLPDVSVLLDPLTGNVLGLQCQLQFGGHQQAVVGLLGQAHSGDHVEGIRSTCCHTVPGHLGKLIYLLVNIGFTCISNQENPGKWIENMSMIQRHSLHQGRQMPLTVRCTCWLLLLMCGSHLS